MPSPPAIKTTEFIIYPAPTKLSFKQSEIGKNSMRPFFYILKHILKPTDRPPAFAVPISFFLPPLPSARRFPLRTKTVNLFFDNKRAVRPSKNLIALYFLIFKQCCHSVATKAFKVVESPYLRHFLSYAIIPIRWLRGAYR